jgi:hypothetical protein
MTSLVTDLFLGGLPTRGLNPEVVAREGKITPREDMNRLASCLPSTEFKILRQERMIIIAAIGSENSETTS